MSAHLSKIVLGFVALAAIALSLPAARAQPTKAPSVQPMVVCFYPGASPPDTPFPKPAQVKAARELLGKSFGAEAARQGNASLNLGVYYLIFCVRAVGDKSVVFVHGLNKMLGQLICDDSINFEADIDLKRRSMRALKFGVPFCEIQN